MRTLKMLNILMIIFCLGLLLNVHALEANEKDVLTIKVGDYLENSSILKYEVTQDDGTIVTYPVVINYKSLLSEDVILKEDGIVKSYYDVFEIESDYTRWKVLEFNVESDKYVLVLESAKAESTVIDDNDKAVTEQKKPVSQEPVKDPFIVDNPNTFDDIYIVLGLFGLLLIVLISLRISVNKFKRYEL